MKRELFKTIVSDILSDDFFSDCKFVKSENKFVIRDGEKFVSAELEHWRDYEDEACVIRPLYGRHFDVLSKWFEKFCVRKLMYQRLDPHIMFDNEDFGQETEITFKYDFSDYEEKFPQLCFTLKENLSDMCEEYATLNDFYSKIVVPQIKGEEELPEAGANWIFEYLTLGYLVDRDNYPTLKKKVLERAEWLLHHHELNVAEYYDRMDEIISYMENNVKL